MIEPQAGMRWDLGPAAAEVGRLLGGWRGSESVKRLWAKDHTLWSTIKQPELTDRLGWLSLPGSMAAAEADLFALSSTVRGRGTTHVVLLGMGGSSLAPGVFQAAFGNRPGFPELVVLDSTHPEAVESVERGINLERTLFLVSSKSGTTTETLSLFNYFWVRVAARSTQPGESFMAISDPGTSLERMAMDRGFFRTFQATPEVGGRYSALSHFGLVPASLIGVDVHRLLENAAEMASQCARSAEENPGAQLGAAIGALAILGRDKLTFVTSPRLAEFASWAEQLIAESTGKDGKGIVPVAGEDLGGPDSYSSDRFFVRMELAGDKGMEGRDARIAALSNAGHPVVDIRLDGAESLGGEFFRWEVAIALAGSVLGINPFDQPDVQLAKDLARRAMRERGREVPASSKRDAGPEAIFAADTDLLEEAFGSWMGRATIGDYVSVQAYLPPAKQTETLLHEARSHLHQMTRMATTVGYGPRFLHSTGQLHKGGPNSGLFLQLTDDAGRKIIPVPETDYTFSDLISAQAAGDLLALQRGGRRVLRIDLGGDVSEGLRRVNRILAEVGGR